ncbi:MAG: hypothetical protein J6Z13_05675 [Clostridia bacterium]|nr:hypothetical protein [Clostridia bacterium]
MKRLTALALCFAMLLPCLLLSSCGGETADATTDDGTYTVTFSVNGEETSVEVAAGEIPEYPGDLSWETDEHYYKITGWDKEFAPADADTTYTAIVGEYGLTVYDVRFNLKTGIVKVPTHEGETPIPPKGYETDLTNVQVIGTFDHWDSEIVAPTAENMEGKKFVMYNPVYVYSTRYYTVKFVIGENEYEVEAAANSVPECPADPTESDDAANKFAGWDKEIKAVTGDITYTAFYGGTMGVEITPAKDGAKAVLTMTYDDGDLATAIWVNQKNKQYGLRGSCMIIASRAAVTDHVAEWRAVFADGTLDPQCHSWTHSSDTVEGPQSLYQREIVDSKTRLEGYFPEKGIICYATPYCQVRNYSYQTDAAGNVVKKNGEPVKVYDGGSNALIQKTYFVNRNGTEGLQPLDPTLDDKAGGWYNVYVQWFYNKTSQTDAQRTGWIDDAVKKSGWLIILAHQIVDSPDNEYKLSKTNAETFFQHASPYVKSGELWAATFGEATKYIRERQNATAYRKMEDGVLTVGVKIDRTTADGLYMDESVFNYPLTVKTKVPAAWNTVSYEFNGETVTTAVKTDPDTNQKYVLVNVIPGGDGAVSSVRVERAD